MNHHRLLLLVLAWISQLVLIQARWRENIIEKRGSDVIEGEGTVQEFSQDSSVDQVVADRQLQTAAKNVGNNGVPASAFPLSMCEGDCDRDSDCAGDLVCYQRNAGGNIPSGCTASSSFKASETDICAKSGSGSSGGGGSSSGGFSLKLYWQQGYMWQEDPREKKWCLKCQGSGCGSGDYLIIVNCVSDNPTRLQFVNYDGFFMIKVRGTNLCAQLNNDSKNYELRGCNSGNSLQRFRSGNGSHNGSGRFEIYPVSKSGFCLTQRHHPKYGEPLRAETCSSARADTTSYWVKWS